MNWSQIYDPLNNAWLSTTFAALPIVVLLGSLAFFHIKAHWAAILGLIVALAVAIFVYGMPTEMAGKSALLGALFGLLPIGWIVLNVIFLYQLTERARACSTCCRRASPASPTTAGCSCCSSRSASARSSRARPASARRSP